MDSHNLSFLRDMFFKTQNICSFDLTSDLQLLYTNCPDGDYFFNLFSVSPCSRAVTEHFKHSSLPVIATDRIGFVWIAAVQPGETENSQKVIHMLGPVFTSRMTESYLNRHLKKLHPAKETESRLIRFIKEVPTVSSEMTVCHANALHFCLNKEAAPPEEILLWSEPVQEAEDLAWGDTNYHGSWLSEQELFKSISEGRFVDHSKINTGKVGNIGGGDPLRQAKNEVIVFAVICSRAAIIGGVSSEGALNLSDYFVQRVEAAESVSEVYAIGAQMQQVYIKRVRRTKAAAAYSAMVRKCMDYTETHIFEKITLSVIAKELGYTETYISRKFREETGGSLVDYVNRAKMNTAKNILQESDISIAELAERMSFSSPSYFSALFKKEFGINPMDYQKKGRKE